MEWIVHVCAVPLSVYVTYYILYITLYVVWLYGDMIIRLMSPQLFLKWVSISDFLFQFLSPWEMSNFISGQMSALQIHSCCSSIQNTSHTHSHQLTEFVFDKHWVPHKSMVAEGGIVSIIPGQVPGVPWCLMFEYSSQSAVSLAAGWRFMWWKKWQMMGIGQIRLLDKKLFLKRLFVSSLSW